MPQFFVAPDLLKQNEIEIRGKDARHLQDVLRLDVGDWVVVCDGIGHRYRAKVVASRPLNVQLSRGEALPEIHLPYHVTLAAAVIRPQRFDWLVEKAFELGCRHLIPLTTERTVATYIKDAEKQHARWSEIAMSAAKQSGLPWLPEVSPLTPLENVIQKPGGQLMYCWEGLAISTEVLSPSKPVIRSPSQSVILNEVKDLKTDSSAAPQNDKLGNTITILIGPEGGFSPVEHDQIMSRHPQLLPLGPLILRSETAAIVALTKVMQ